MLLFYNLVVVIFCCKVTIRNASQFVVIQIKPHPIHPPHPIKHSITPKKHHPLGLHLLQPLPMRLVHVLVASHLPKVVPQGRIHRVIRRRVGRWFVVRRMEACANLQVECCCRATGARLVGIPRSRRFPRLRTEGIHVGLARRQRIHHHHLMRVLMRVMRVLMMMVVVWR